MDLGHAPPSARAKAKTTRESVRLGADAHGWTYRSGKNKLAAQVGDEVEPTARQMIEAVLAQPSITSQMGDLLWWYLSGVTHGEMYALMQSIQVLEQDSAIIGEPIAAFYTRAGDVAIMGQATLEAYVRVTDRVADLMGWSSDEWNTVAAQTGDMGKQIATAVAEQYAAANAPTS